MKTHIQPPKWDCCVFDCIRKKEFPKIKLLKKFQKPKLQITCTISLIWLLFNIPSSAYSKAACGHREALEFLLKFLPDIEVKDKQGRTALDLACIKGESSCVECLMFNNADCQSRDSVTGRTPIHSAALNNHEECLKIIILIANSKLEKKKLNRTFDSSDCFPCYDENNMKNSFYNSQLANLKDFSGRTPLMLATEHGHLNTITFLTTQMGADVLVSDGKGRTALHRAVSNLFFYLALVASC